MVSRDQQAANVTAFESVVKVAAFGRTPIPPQTGWCTLAPIMPAGGCWYFSFECPRCQRMSPMFRDYSDGNLDNPFCGYGVVATCYFCKAEVSCASEHFMPAQWPLKPGETAVRSEYENRVQRKYEGDPEQRPIQGPLHHYTSLDALLSIVNDRALRATNVHYLNDSSESEIGLKLITQVAKEARATADGIDAEFLNWS